MYAMNYARLLYTFFISCLCQSCGIGKKDTSKQMNVHSGVMAINAYDTKKRVSMSNRFKTWYIYGKSYRQMNKMRLATATR